MSIIKSFSSKVVSAVFTVSLAGGALAQSQGPNIYDVQCMKSKSPGYVDLEIKKWQPIHQYLVDHGKKEWWRLSAVAVGDRTKCDYYIVEAYTQEQLKQDDNGWNDAIKNVVGSNSKLDKLTAETAMARDHVSTMRYIGVVGIEMKPNRFARMNFMHVEPENIPGYIAVESTIFRPLHQKVQEWGGIQGWGVARLVEPQGMAQDHNFITVDTMNELGPQPYDKAFAEVFPNLDINLLDVLVSSRTMVNSIGLDEISSTKPRQ